MADAQTVKDAASLRAAAENLGLAGDPLDDACSQIIAEDKEEKARIVFERTKAALKAESQKQDNLYDRIKNNKF